VGSLALSASASALPSEYVLPGDRVFPEGIAIRPGTDQFFVSSTTDGTIFRGTFGKRRTKVFLRPGRHGRVSANGLAATRDRLVVAGSVANRIFVYSLPDGRLVSRFNTGTGGLVNDVKFARNGDVYATDSSRGLVFRVPARLVRKRHTAVRRINPFVTVLNTPIGQYANGLAPVGDRYLLVVGLSTGVLGRIDLKTKQVRTVDLDADTIPAGDGLARDGRTLYAVNAASRVSEYKLARNWLSGKLRRHITSPRFRLPSTLALTPKRLLVVNAQFDKRSTTPRLPFTVSAVKRP
jgi:Cu-Zn family superoxide dismutase